MGEKWKLSEAWASIVAVIAATLALFMLGAAWWQRPLPRATLTPIEQIGPMMVDTRLVRYGGVGPRQTGGSYRTQDVRLTAGGPHSGAYRPAKALWIDELDHVRDGQKILFLVDPQERLIYEASSNGRLLLAYEKTADKLYASAQRTALLGAGCLVVALFWGGPVLWRRRGRLLLSD